MSRRYCIGCIHFVYENESLAMGSEWTGMYGESMKLACGKGHWEVDNRNTTQGEFAKFMESADTCDDFSERPTP